MTLNTYDLSIINRDIETDPNSLVVRSEQRYSEQLERIADGIVEVHMERPFILLSGPSGSGKTTTALRIEALLDGFGFETHTISLDNYFLPNDAPGLPFDEDGKPDYESPFRLDIKLLNRHMDQLFRNETVEIPRFDFATQTRKSGNMLQRKPGELILIEGIHTLNPIVMSAAIPVATTIYTCINTRIVDGARELLPPRLRLVRRLVRDRLFRGCNLSATLDRFESVSRGEVLHIAPFRATSMVEVDTFLPYEIAVYASVLSDAEHELPPDIAEFLRNVTPLEAAISPNDSIIREVTGASVFQY